LHIHLADGRISGGHPAAGSRVRTTAELLVALPPTWTFHRAIDPTTEAAELRIKTPGSIPSSARTQLLAGTAQGMAMGQVAEMGTGQGKQALLPES
jgi:hypothetical protein